MAKTDKTLRVPVVDDNRDGADALGLLVEELGNQVHVTYGGTKALDNPFILTLAVDHDGNIYGTNESQQVAKITPQGAISIVGAGIGLAADSQGDIFSVYNSISQIN